MNAIQEGTRIGFRNGLMELAEKRGDVVLVSTDSLLALRGEPFAQKFPHRFIELGIAEQNGVAVCAGLASAGLTPYIGTYAGFLTMRACEQMRTYIAYPRLKVRFIGCNGGLLGGNREGVSHQFIEDVGLLRTIPGFTILCPADGNQTRQAILASADTDGPVYIRIGSGREENVFSPDDPFPLGKIRILQDYGDDIVLFTYGFTLGRVLEAAEELKAKGVKAKVVEAATIKPLDAEGIAGVLAKTKCALTVEDHTVTGGLGSAVAEVIAEKAPAVLARLGLQDTYGESGFPDELLDAYGMSVNTITRTAEELVSKKRQL
ncbi:MAG: transketolase [Spirochaetales bacterium]|jgi:transketolase|nr:transketolase [Spirochaetales bacterium]